MKIMLVNTTYYIKEEKFWIYNFNKSQFHSLTDKPRDQTKKHHNGKLTGGICFLGFQ